MNSKLNELIGIGPMSPPITGPGIKNRAIKTGLENNGYNITWIDTLGDRKRSVYQVIKSDKDSNFIVSVSTNGRFLLSPILVSKMITGSSRAILLPAGGEFKEELANLPYPTNKIYRYIFNKYDGIFPESEIEAKELKSFFNQAIKITSLPNPRSRPNTCNIEVGNSTLDLVYVGRVKETKGLDYLIDGFECARQTTPSISLDIYGHFLPNDEYELRFRRKCNQAEAVEYKGKIPDGEVMKTLREYDLLVFPTYYDGEGFPGVIVEAFMTGTPVLASNWNYNMEIVDHGYNGRLFEPQNSYEIAKNIKWFNQNPGKLEQMKKNAWKCSKRYSTDTVVEDLINILIDIGWELDTS
ncbi:hypothetical protein DJ73_13305 [Halorubrum sp. Ea1]|uniref:glycosyltransferase family 4 protein n=1 Tax=Halorubrum sp. Ea1 TaxID=1480718 RepID=UPI000B98F630|nr:glycosyltransferase [Halorubrum sp. Ea1]OYR51426.1 hypothetical protein DJ73_13305 [Halorubrum sp. Ea1]